MGSGVGVSGERVAGCLAAGEKGRKRHFMKLFMLFDLPMFHYCCWKAFSWGVSIIWTYLYLAMYAHSMYLNKSRFAHACLHLERKPLKVYKPLQVA